MLYRNSLIATMFAVLTIAPRTFAQNIDSAATPQISTTDQNSLDVTPTISQQDAATTLAVDSSASMDSTQNATNAESAKAVRADRRAGRGLLSIKMDNDFVPKGQWIIGCNASYGVHSNNDYSFLIIEGIDSDGYDFMFSPLIAYSVHGNTALGVRFGYTRSLLKLGNTKLSFGDEQTGVNITIDNFYTLSHRYTGAFVWRQYIPLGNSKRFALFAETHLGFGVSQSKFAGFTPIKGTYEQSWDISLGISPGIVAFASNTMAIELSVGMLGLNYSLAKQTHNQIETGKRDSATVNFRINLLAIGLGVSFYL